MSSFTKDPPAYDASAGSSNMTATKETKVTLLLTVPHVSVTQIYEGEEVPLATGDLELSLIPASPDNFLVLKVSEVEIVLTPESQIFKKGETGLFVPWTELPGAMLLFNLAACDHEYVETLDTYLVDFTRMPAPEPDLRNQLALVDDSGQVIGELEVNNTQDLARPALDRTDSSKEPVIVDIDKNGDVLVEKYRDSKIVQGSNYVSTGILYSANMLSSGLQKGSDWLNSRSPAVEKDVEFSAATKASTRKIHSLTTGVSHVSSKTVGYVSTLAEKAGGRVASRKKTYNKDGTPASESSDNKPGILSQSAFALVTVLEAVDRGSKQVLGSASDSVGRVVQHRYGSQAGAMANELGGSVKNVALVYFDAKGISHRALLKSGIKGGVKARLSDGRQVVLQDDHTTTTGKKTM